MLSPRPDAKPAASPDVRHPREGRRPTLRERKKADTWHRILAAARDEFSETGFRQTCLEQVAARAGVGKGTVYRHVESKAELYVAVLSQELRSFDEEMGRVVEAQLTASEKIAALGSWYVASFATPGFHLVHWALDNQDVIGEIPQGAIDEIQSYTRMRLRRLEEVIREGIDTGEFVPCDSWLVANLLWTMVEAFVELVTSPARRELVDRPLDQTFRGGLGIVLRGLRKP